MMVEKIMTQSTLMHHFSMEEGTCRKCGRKGPKGEPCLPFGIYGCVGGGCYH